MLASAMCQEIAQVLQLDWPVIGSVNGGLKASLRASESEFNRNRKAFFLAEAFPGFKLRQASGKTEQQNWQTALDEIESFLANL